MLTWNPNNWQWNDIAECINEIDQEGICNRRWSTGVTKKIQLNDRVFLMKLGKPPRGLMASGWAASPVFEDTHWGNPTKKAFDCASLFL